MTIVAAFRTDDGILIFSDLMISGVVGVPGSSIDLPTAHFKNRPGVPWPFEARIARKVHIFNNRLLFAYSGLTTQGTRAARYLKEFYNEATDAPKDITAHFDWIKSECADDIDFILISSGPLARSAVYYSGAQEVSFRGAEGLAIGSGFNDFVKHIKSYEHTLPVFDDKFDDVAFAVYLYSGASIAGQRIAGHGLGANQRFGGAFEFFKGDGNRIYPMEGAAFVAGRLDVDSKNDIWWRDGITLATYYEEGLPVCASVMGRSGRAFPVQSLLGEIASVQERIFSPSFILTQFVDEHSISTDPEKAPTVVARGSFYGQSLPRDGLEFLISYDGVVTRDFSPEFLNKILAHSASALKMRKPFRFIDG